MQFLTGGREGNCDDLYCWPLTHSLGSKGWVGINLSLCNGSLFLHYEVLRSISSHYPQDLLIAVNSIYYVFSIQTKFQVILFLWSTVSYHSPWLYTVHCLSILFDLCEKKTLQTNRHSKDDVFTQKSTKTTKYTKVITDIPINVDNALNQKSLDAGERTARCVTKQRLHRTSSLPDNYKESQQAVRV